MSESLLFVGLRYCGLNLLPRPLALRRRFEGTQPKPLRGHERSAGIRNPFVAWSDQIPAHWRERGGVAKLHSISFALAHSAVNVPRLDSEKQFGNRFV